jgi:hypothetical protein
MKRRALEKRNSWASISSGERRPARRRAKLRRFALCVKNTGYGASLELRKLYSLVPDLQAAAHGLIRVVDESGEDYLYPAKFFVVLSLPQRAKRAMRLAS